VRTGARVVTAATVTPAHAFVEVPQFHSVPVLFTVRYSAGRQVISTCTFKTSPVQRTHLYKWSIRNLHSVTTRFGRAEAAASCAA
jgi:hypothetical protein